MTPPVYLFTGPEFGERNDAIENLKNSVSKKFGSVDNYLFYASETPVNEFMSVLQNESLFSEATFITVKNAETIKKKDELISQQKKDSIIGNYQISKKIHRI